MPSRMDKYYKKNEKKRIDKNQELYRTMYDNAKYNNIEELSVIEKNEKIDIDKIRELINGTKNINKPKKEKKVDFQPLVEEIEEQKNYDIRDVLNKAKNERTTKDSKYSNTRYNAVINDELDKEIEENEKKLKDIIETINVQSDDTLDLLDDLKSICDPNLKKEINDQEDEIIETDDIDKSFYTSSMNFSKEDFEGDDKKPKNKIFLKVLLFILLIILVASSLFFIKNIK